MKLLAPTEVEDNCKCRQCSKHKDDARRWFYQLRQKFLDYNGAEWRSDDFNRLEKEIRDMVQGGSVPQCSSPKRRWSFNSWSLGSHSNVIFSSFQEGIIHRFHRLRRL